MTPTFIFSVFEFSTVETDHSVLAERSIEVEQFIFCEKKKNLYRLKMDSREDQSPDLLANLGKSQQSTK